MTSSESYQLQHFLGENLHLGQSALLPALQFVQKQYGYISASAAVEIGEALRVPLADLYGVIEFYSLLTTRPTGKTVLQVCCDPVCALAGADQVLEAVQSEVEIDPAASNGAQKDFHVERVSCLGLCNHAPAVKVGDHPVGFASPFRLDDLLRPQGDHLEDYVGGSLQILTANCRRPGTTGLEDYQAGGGYAGFRKALSLAPKDIVEEVKAASLVGRGGAAFPSGIKWEAVSNAASAIKYVVCNADESEPGTFKDRILLEKDPHRTLEGMLIAAYAVGASKGYIYLRGEYTQALHAVEEAVASARQAGLIGERILSSGFNFEIEIRQGAGAYICGEETALFESIEGKRGFPRIKPPFPTTHGLFGQPTLVNNVETLCNVPYLVTAGSQAYLQIGTARSSGPKLFSVCGDIVRPGLYEVPFGISLRELLYEMAGGLPEGRQLGAVLLGGAAGAFAGEEHLDIPLSFEHLREAGLVLGSGAVMVFDESRDLREVLKRVAHFFAEESCGKCYPCQIGTLRQFEILDRAASGSLLPGDDIRLADVSWTMTDASLCGLGQTAGLAVISALKRYPHLFTVPDQKTTS